MLDDQIIDGDRYFYDRSLTPKNGQLVYITFLGERYLRKYYKNGSDVRFVAANEDCADIVPTEAEAPKVEGVVTGLFRSYL